MKKESNRTPENLLESMSVEKRSMSKNKHVEKPEDYLDLFDKLKKENK